MSHTKSGENATSPQPLVLSGHTRWVHSVGFLPDGNQFLSGSMDGTMRTWGTKQAREVRPPIDCKGMVSIMAVSNDGRWIATGTDKWHVVLWDATTHEKVGESADRHKGGIECLSFSVDATTVVSGSGDTTVAVWRVPTAERLAGMFRGHVQAINSVVFSPDGERLASTDGDDIRIRDSRSGNLVVPLIGLGNWINSLAWVLAPNDQMLYATFNNQIVGIDASTGAVCLRWTAHRMPISRIVFSLDGQLIVASSNFDQTVQIWSTATQQEYAPALRHNARVLCTAISPDGSRVIAGGEDSTVYVWPIRGNLPRIEEVTSSHASSMTVCVMYVHCAIRTVDNAPRHLIL